MSKGGTPRSRPDSVCRRLSRDVFFAYNGPGPWPCHSCGEPLSIADVFDVHHLDENPMHNVPENLVPMHRQCHRKWPHSRKKCVDGCRCGRHDSKYVERTTKKQRVDIASRGRATVRASHKERNDGIVRAYRAGQSAADIGAAVSLTGRQVSMILSERNIPMRGRWG